MLDLDRPLKTRNGNKVTILMRDCGDPNRPISGLIHYPNGGVRTTSWRRNGMWLWQKYSPNDLVNEPPQYVSYHNVCRDGYVSQGFAYLPGAPRGKRSAPRIATIKVTYTPGRGASAEVIQEFESKE